MDCSSCGSYELYKMVTSAKPYGYSGEIPCLSCSRFSWLKDNYKPVIHNDPFDPAYIKPPTKEKDA